MYLLKKDMEDTNIKEYCYILNYSNGDIWEIKLYFKDYDENNELDIEKVLYEHGFNIDECSWMLSSTKLYIIEEN